MMINEILLLKSMINEVEILNDGIATETPRTTESFYSFFKIETQSTTIHKF